MRRILLASLALMLTAPAAYAQDSGISDRLNRLERDITFLQRQVYRGGAPSGDINATPVPEGINAQLQVKLTQIDEEMRALRGQIEQVQFENRKTSEDFRKYREDMDYRMQTLETKLMEAQAAPAPVEDMPPGEEKSVPAESEAPAAYEPEEVNPKPAATGRDFPDSNAHYNHAFKLMNDKNYSAAASSFDAFVKKYPKDPLTSNAYYWLGESYYARGDYTRAASGFRKGFESNPQGQKAADNLLKLAMSLAQVKRVPEACVVLDQVVKKYGDASPRTRERAMAERTKLQCK